jgi:ATP-dependent RNA helicase DDX1
VLHPLHQQVYTDNVHVHDQIGPNSRTPECASEAVKRLKPRLLQRIVDAFAMDQCLIFCRTNFDCDNLEKFLNELGGGASGFSGKAESGKEGKYSCVVLAGQRSMEERRRALQVGCCMCLPRVNHVAAAVTAMR